jgi:hypothetical protein
MQIWGVIFLKILSVTAFAKIPLNQLLTGTEGRDVITTNFIQFVLLTL